MDLNKAHRSLSTEELHIWDQKLHILQNLKGAMRKLDYSEINTSGNLSFFVSLFASDNPLDRDLSQSNLKGKANLRLVDSIRGTLNSRLLLKGNMASE
jgi:hypothetical protein